MIIVSSPVRFCRTRHWCLRWSGYCPQCQPRPAHSVGPPPPRKNLTPRPHNQFCLLGHIVVCCRPDLIISLRGLYGMIDAADRSIFDTHHDLYSASTEFSSLARSSPEDQFTASLAPPFSPIFAQQLLSCRTRKDQIAPKPVRMVVSHPLVAVQGSPHINSA